MTRRRSVFGLFGASTLVLGLSLSPAPTLTLENCAFAQSAPTAAGQPEVDYEAVKVAMAANAVHQAAALASLGDGDGPKFVIVLAPDFRRPDRFTRIIQKDPVLGPLDIVFLQEDAQAPALHAKGGVVYFAGDVAVSPGGYEIFFRDTTPGEATADIKWALQPPQQPSAQLDSPASTRG